MNFLKDKKLYRTSAGILIVSLFFTLVKFIFIIAQIAPFVHDNPTMASTILKNLVSHPLIIASNIVALLAAFFVYGSFIRIGKKLKNKFLIFGAWTIIAASVFYFFASVSNHLINPSLQILFGVLMIAGMIFFGIGILRAHEHLAFSKTIGILEIIAGVSFVIIIGALVHFVALIFMTVLLWREYRGEHR